MESLLEPRSHWGSETACVSETVSLKESSPRLECPLATPTLPVWETPTVTARRHHSESVTGRKAAWESVLSCQ